MEEMIVPFSLHDATKSKPMHDSKLEKQFERQRWRIGGLRWKVYTYFLLITALSTFGSSASGQDCSKFAAANRQAVVSLSIEKTRKETGVVEKASATGFIVSDEGHVLTAYHVIASDANYDEISIFGAIGSLNAPRAPMRVVEESKTSEVALLQFKDSSAKYTPVELGDPWNPAVGSQLCGLGFSAPLKEDYRVTTGTLSSRNSEDESAGVKNLWTTQMPSNYGESGAPVVELTSGKVVALKYGGKDPSKAQNVNYLIPINLAESMIRKHIRPRPPKVLEPEDLLTDSQRKARQYLREADDYRSTREYSQAFAYYDLAIKFDPKLVDAYLHRSDLLMREKKYDEAIRDCTEVLRLDPKNFLAFTRRGGAYDKLEKYQEEVDNYTEAMVSDRSAWVYLGRGRAYRKKGDYDLAIADLSEVLKRIPDSWDAYLERGWAYRRKGYFDKAIEDLTRAIQFVPDNAEAYYQRALTHMDKGDKGDKSSYDFAIADFTRAEGRWINPRAYLYMYRGKSQAQKGEYTEAIRDYKLAITRNPKIAEAYRLRATAYRAIGRIDLADIDEAKAREMVNEKN